MELKSGVSKVERFKFEVKDLDHASRVFQQYRDMKMKEGFGNKDLLAAFVVENGRRIAFISWNGRVWNSKAFKGGNKAEYLISEAA